MFDNLIVFCSFLAKIDLFCSENEAKPVLSALLKSFE